MTKETISNAVTNINSRYIEEAVDYQIKQKKTPWIKIGAIAASFALCFFLSERLTEIYPDSTDKTPMINQEEKETTGEDRIIFPTLEQDKTLEFSEDIGKTPPYNATDLTKEALYEQMAAFLPAQAPSGFTFTSASMSDYGYSVIWSKGLEDLSWRIRDYKDSDAAYIIDVTDTKTYDLSLYPIPRYDSVPKELHEIVENPIFRMKDLTQEVVNARAYKVEDAGDSNGYRMHFSVILDNKVITITSKGVSPEWLYKELSGLSGNPKISADVPVSSIDGDSGALNTFDKVWGGSYMDQNGKWVVLLTEDTPENRAEVLKRNSNLSENNIRFEKANYSLAYLTQVMAAISQAMADKELKSVFTATLYEDRNCIVVEMTDSTEEAAVLAFDTLGGAIEIQIKTQQNIVIQESQKEVAN